MTTHIVCLDGTNQTKTQSCPTNIAHIFDAIGGTATVAGNGSFETAAPGASGKYLPGVGATGSLPLRLLGNLFGDGIAEPIIRGYTYLSRSWKEGDAILITGFSRGATAARALAGLAVNRGLLDPTRYNANDKDLSYKRAIAAWYAYRHGKPDLANQSRLQLFRNALGQVPRLKDEDYTPPITVAAVGVFDTVSSLGLPSLDWNGDAQFDFTICDTTLSPRVAHGFHALAADEERELFSPTFWADRPGSVVQQIFPGGHADIGGGHSERGLSDCTLDWMISKLNGVANVLDPRRLGAAFRPDALATAHDDGRIFPFTATPRRARSFPKEATPSNALRQRRNQISAVLPGTMKGPYDPTGRYADGSSLL